MVILWGWVFLMSEVPLYMAAVSEGDFGPDSIYLALYDKVPTSQK